MTEIPVSIADRYENALYDLSRSLFASILQSDATNDSQWRHRIKTFELNGLLSFLVESNHKPAPLKVDQSRLEDARYRRHLAGKLKVPRPSKYVSVRIAIDRDRLAADPSYLADMCKLLAYNWVKKLLLDTNNCDRLLLLKQDERTLRRALDTMRIHESSGHSVAQLLLRLGVDDLLDASDTMKQLLAKMQTETSVIVSEFTTEIRGISGPILERARASFDRIMADTHKSCDEAIEKIRKELAVSIARTDRVLAECAAEDPDVAWRRAMAERERERKLKTRKTNWIWYTVFSTLAIVIVLHAEVNGVRAIDVLGQLVDSYVSAR